MLYITYIYNYDILYICIHLYLRHAHIYMLFIISLSFLLFKTRGRPGAPVDVPGEQPGLVSWRKPAKTAVPTAGHLR